jgi:hypothetical protein
MAVILDKGPWLASTKSAMAVFGACHGTFVQDMHQNQELRWRIAHKWQQKNAVKASLRLKLSRIFGPKKHVDSTPCSSKVFSARTI